MHRVATAAPELTAYYRHAGDAFLPKSDAVPLQAADLLAWEWAKFHDETFRTARRPMRGSLRALFTHAPKRYQVAHLEGSRLAEGMQKYAMLGLEQVAEEAIARSWGG